MDEFELMSFAVWSAVTGIAVLVTGFSYRVYLHKKKTQISSF